jgi:hypothetical protein
VDISTNRNAPWSSTSAKAHQFTVGLISHNNQRTCSISSKDRCTNKPMTMRNSFSSTIKSRLTHIFSAIMSRTPMTQRRRRSIQILHSTRTGRISRKCSLEVSSYLTSWWLWQQKSNVITCFWRISQNQIKPYDNGSLNFDF